MNWKSVGYGWHSTAGSLAVCRCELNQNHSQDTELESTVFTASFSFFSFTKGYFKPQEMDLFKLNCCQVRPHIS